MDINILLPYKEEYNSKNSGAVSIFVKDQLQFSKFKKQTYIYGISSNNKKKLKNFITLPKSKYLRNFNYVKKFSHLIKNKKTLVELHNRPKYFIYLKKKAPSNKYILYFHNDPLGLQGSKSVAERIHILKNCNYLIFISKWIKNKFFTGININNYNNYKIIPHGSNKINKIPKKKNFIFFCGKLNSAKGFDLFCKATKKFLEKNPQWQIFAAGSESRRNIPMYDHVKELGQISHNSVLSFIKNSKITVAPSVWNEPLGRLPIESASLGSVCVSSSNGGLIESNENGIVIDNINETKLYKALIKLSVAKTYNFFQKKVFNKFSFSNKIIYKKIDSLRIKILNETNYNNKLKILHISNFNDNANGRLFYSIPRKLNNGFTNLKHNILSIDDKLFLRNHFFFKKFFFNKKILDIVNNFSPNLILIGHSESLTTKTYKKIRNIDPKIKIVRYYVDSISKEFFNRNSKILLNNIDYIDHIFITSKTNNLLKKYHHKISYIPNPVDKSIDTLKNFNNNQYEYDLFFALSHGQNRGKFKNYFKDERDNFVHNINIKTPFLKKFFIYSNFNTPVWGTNYYELLSKCKMGLNISRGKYQHYYSSDRISSLFGNGLLVFIDKKTKLNKFFNNNEAVFFKNTNDLIKKLYYYNKNLSKCRIIAKNGYLKYHNYFSNIEICNFILKKVNLININKNYIWEHLD